MINDQLGATVNGQLSDYIRFSLFCVYLYILVGTRLETLNHGIILSLHTSTRYGTIHFYLVYHFKLFRNND